MKFGKSILGNYEEGTNREFLVSNGIGGFSSGCINGNFARRYHGLLISSLLPPLDRYLYFHKIEENIDGIDISTYKIFEDTEKINKGYIYQLSFEQNPFPKFKYSVNGNIFEKEIFMITGKNSVIVKYKLKVSSKSTVNAKFNLFFNYRDTHKMNTTEIEKYSVKKEPDFLSLKIEDNNVPIYIYSNKIDKFNTNMELRNNIVYDIEQDERGDKSFDSSVSIGEISCKMKENDEIYIVVSNEKINNINLDELYKKEIKRIEKLKKDTSKNNNILQDLSVAADSFIVYRKGTNGKTILAGYPWFGDWGRDTMIALPGLTLSTNRFEDAKSILKTFAKYCDKGMLPNKFPDWEGEELYYNTIDASLWIFYAVYKFLEYTKEYDFIKNEIYPALKNIIQFHIDGTRYNIKADEKDGLISGGDENTQLTWMDVAYKGWAVTPRYGKAVEINALWYNALKIMEDLSDKFNKNNDVYKLYSKKVEENYEKVFWNEKSNCLYDYIDNNNIKNEDIRPNQIFAVSLPYTVLSKEKEKQIVDLVLNKLYTPHGLKSLSSNNEKYIGIYKGSLFERDSSYHQGTVWSWPLGHFITAYNKVYNDKEKIKLLLDGIIEHFYQEGCVNNISEIFDGDSPNLARGCFAQAWSVAEIIRVMKEELNEE
ncbi:amylo-alpha-1,6-glucosidase [Haliovirga abyssi]|uniref:Glycogen debranching protein n=1 Tax=Haliovirga abyssi TaxID=2996794 RepID=A0AAU9DE23_9FUSO|nr:amylo-alpha-1,6-glucosidase [Haliovirga abyssi]BDU50438.1 glycogen debranching protein [Haliovirga abyssi]